MVNSSWFTFALHRQGWKIAEPGLAIVRSLSGMVGLAARLLPYALAFFSSLCIMILELVSSRLVARHVGSSLTVWTSVIGIILGGICLGNVLGGRLADRVEPRRAVGPLFALGSLLTLGCLWVNAELGHIIPAPETINWELRTVLVVILDFLIPATVLGMVGPVVAKMAVERSQRSGSAIGDVYFCGAIGSIVGTFLAGFVLMYLAPTSTIVLVVAAALALLAALLSLHAVGLVLGSGHRGSPRPGLDRPPGPTARPGGRRSRLLPDQLPCRGREHHRDPAGPCGTGESALGPAATTWRWAARRKRRPSSLEPTGLRPSLSDLAVLAFLASLAFMAMEMVAGRLVTRHLGSSIYGWTSVIAVLLAGLSLGNYLGGRVANLIRNEKQASWLFLAASVFTLSILLLEAPPKWLREMFDLGLPKSVLSTAITWSELKLPRAGDHSPLLALPRAPGHDAGLLPPVGLDGDGQPGRGQARGGPAQTVQAHRHGHRPGLRLGHGRQHSGHLPDRLLPDRSDRHQGGAADPGHRDGLRGNGTGVGLARGLGRCSPGALRGRVPAPGYVPEDG